MRERIPVILARTLVGAALVGAGLVFGHAAMAQSAPKDGPAVWPYLATLGADERLATLKREAIREGELVIYSAIGLDRAGVFLDMFKKQYPGIKIEYLRMTTNEIAQKVLTEFRAGRTNADIVMSSSEWLGLLKDA